MPIKRKHPFWDLEQGAKYKDLRRSIASLHLSLETEPTSKKASRKSLQGDLRELMSEDSLPWVKSEGKYGTKWPRKRGDIALDLYFTSTVDNPPRVDTICKWLLDLLGEESGKSIVYRDDRQVKLLFAKLFQRSRVVAEQGAIYIQAQSSRDAMFGIVRANSMEIAWPNDPENFNEDWFEDDYAQDGATAVSKDSEEHSELFQFWRDYDLKRRRSKLHHYLLGTSDSVSTQVFVEYSREGQEGNETFVRTRAYLQMLSSHPYAFNLGPLPTQPGDTSQFKARIRQTFADYVGTHQNLFPLYATAGLTLFYVESPTGKDLDNIFQFVVPIVLECLTPPPRDRLFESELVPFMESGLHFLEAISLRIPTDGSIPPGTVILCLSTGDRHESKWQEAQTHIEKNSDGFV